MGGYLRSRFLLVDSEHAKQGKRNDYIIELNEPLVDVVGLEIIQGSLNEDILPSWRSNHALRYPTQPSIGNDETSFKVRVSDSLNHVEFIVDMDHGPNQESYCWQIFDSSTSFADALQIVLRESFKRATSIPQAIDYTNTSLNVQADAHGRMEFVAYRTLSPHQPMMIELLFESSKGPFAATTLGFNPGFNTTKPPLRMTTGMGSGFNYVLTAIRHVNLVSSGYLDVTIRQIENELSSVARLYYHLGERPSGHWMCRRGSIDTLPRLLHQPLRRLEKLSIQLTTGSQKNLVPVDTIKPHTFQIMVIQLVNEQTTPRWMKQTIAY